MTGPAISTACPPALGRVGAPRPWTARGNRSVPPLGSGSRSASWGWSANCYGASRPTGSNEPHRGGPNTEFPTPPADGDQRASDGSPALSPLLAHRDWAFSCSIRSISNSVQRAPSPHTQRPNTTSFAGRLATSHGFTSANGSSSSAIGPGAHALAIADPVDCRNDPLHPSSVPGGRGPFRAIRRRPRAGRVEPPESTPAVCCRIREDMPDRGQMAWERPQLIVMQKMTKEGRAHRGPPPDDLVEPGRRAHAVPGRRRGRKPQRSRRDPRLPAPVQGEGAPIIRYRRPARLTPLAPPALAGGASAVAEKSCGASTSTSRSSHAGRCAVRRAGGGVGEQRAGDLRPTGSIRPVGGPVTRAGW